jgi:hypothetical protein
MPTISVTDEVKKRIRTYGVMGDSFNFVISKILDDYEKLKAMRKMDETIEQSELVTP